MKKTYCALMATALLLSTGCNKENETQISGGDPKVGIVTSISAEGIMRSPQLDEDGSGNFSAGDVFSLMAISESGRKTLLDYESGSTVLYWKEIAMEQGDRSVVFSACYPRQEISDGKFTFDLSSAEDKDLLWAQTADIEACTEAPVALTFRHAMHRLIINISADAGVDASEVKVECTAKSSCEVDLVSCELDDSASETETFSSAGPNAEFLLVPQAVSDISMTVDAGGIRKMFALGDIVKEHDRLESGMQLTVNMTVKNGNIQIEGTSIEGWGNQGTVDGEIIM